jgi:hypothetical protein
MSRIAEVPNALIRKPGKTCREHLHFFERQYHFSERHRRAAPQLLPPGTFPCCEAPVYAIVLEVFVWHRCPFLLVTVRYPPILRQISSFLHADQSWERDEADQQLVSQH